MRLGVEETTEAAEEVAEVVVEAKVRAVEEVEVTRLGVDGPT